MGRRCHAGAAVSGSVQSAQDEGDVAVIRFVGHVRLNPAFVTVMREQHVELDERELFNGANYESGTPETSAVFAAITKRAEKVFPDFTIERQIILGCFMSPGSLILAESQHIIDTLAEGATGNTVLDALAGSKEAAEALKDPAHLRSAHSTPIRTTSSKSAMSTTPCGTRPIWSQPGIHSESMSSTGVTPPITPPPSRRAA